MKLLSLKFSKRKIGLSKLFLCFLVILLLLFQSCKSPEPVSPNEETPLANNELIPLTSKIVLPQNSALKPEDLTLFSAIDQEYQISADGSVSYKIDHGGPGLVTVHNSDGDILLMGWVDSTGQPSISARTTAEVFAFFDTGGFMLPDNLKSQLIIILNASPDLADLTSAIENALSASSPSLGSITAIRKQTAEKLLQINSPTPAPNGIRVEPQNPKSGITILQEGLNTIKIKNDYRRRAMAYVDRVSPKEEIKKLNLSPTLGATSFLGVITDLGIKYFYDANKAAYYQGVPSDPINLELVPEDAEKTDYEVTVIGMGFSAGSESKLNSERLKDLHFLIAKTLIVDFLVPLVANVFIPHAGEAIDNYFNLGDANSIVGTFINTLGNFAPNLWDKAYSGDFKGALTDAWTGVVSDGSVQTAFLKLCSEVVLTFRSYDDHVTFTKRARFFLNIVGLGNLILTAFDSFAQTAAFAYSSRAETWNITVNQSKVFLTPYIGDIVKGEKITFKANVPEAGGSQINLTYNWSTTGNHGSLKDGTKHQGNDFSSTSNEVEYISDGNTFGEDEIIVEAFELIDMQKNSIGKDTVKIIVRDAVPLLVPKEISLWPPDVQKFEVRIPESLIEEGDELSYIWSTTGKYGGFVTGGNNYESTLDVASWMVRGNYAEGTDNVTVEVFRMRDGKSESLGNATAEILVEQKKTVIEGSWGIEEKEADAGRSCANAYIYVPKVEDAIQYDMDAYHFNDPLYFGKEYSRTWTGPQSDHGNKSTAIEDLGSQWRIGLSGGCGPDEGQADRVSNLKSRFAGMVVEVTITRSN